MRMKNVNERGGTGVASRADDGRNGGRARPTVFVDVAALSKPEILIWGRTYPYKEEIKKLGGQWLPRTKQWCIVVENKDEKDEVLQRLAEIFKNETV
ncbi:MAG: hypothetical protein ACXQS1_03380, partial [Methermicoccaceae archaeon]